MAYAAPNFTQIPNALIEQLPMMPDSAVRVSIAVARQTFGWHKKKDRISLTQLEKMTGLSRPGVIMGANWLILHGHMQKEWVDEKMPGKGCYYELIVNDVDQSTALTTYRPNKHPASQSGLPDLVNDVDTQKKLSNKPKTKRNKKIAASAAAAPDLAQTPIEPEGEIEQGNASPLQQSPIDDDVPPAPPPPVVKPAKAPRQPDPVFDRLCTMTESVAAIDGGMIGKTRQTINKDDKHPCTVANLDLFMLWWCSADNWRKKSSAVPELKQMPGLWGKAMAWAEKHAPKPAPIVEQLSPDEEAAQMAAAWAEYEAQEAERTRRRIAAGYIKA